MAGEEETKEEQTKIVLPGKYYSVQDLAKHFGYTRAWISHLINAKQIKAVRPTGTSWRIPESEFNRLNQEGLSPKPRVKPKPIVKKIPISADKLNRIAPDYKPPLEKQELPEPSPKEEKKGKYRFSFLPFSDLE